MIFEYKGYGYRLEYRGQDHIWYKIKKLKWHWYKRAEILKRGYDSKHRWLYVEREEGEVTEEYVMRTHKIVQHRIDEFLVRDADMARIRELIHEPNIEFMNRVMK